MSKEEYNFEKAKQGPVVRSFPGKTRITIRVDTDILNWYRKKVHKRGGGNYQILINDAHLPQVRAAISPHQVYWHSRQPVNFQHRRD